ncbi:hypothetical protein HPP92_001905 [Vanilla planifolia]|uniref:Pectinesterase inhibitor domain-containing protein n=1 Tax=Vanilla planifolia TaxID=51239 RepID=A0A835VM02_VANPL|nr:hypothetical protein HPP92_001905 [Vanilla planifolia]
MAPATALSLLLSVVLLASASTATTTTAPGPQLIRAACANVAPDQDLCFSSISSHPASAQADLRQLAAIAVRAADEKSGRHCRVPLHVASLGHQQWRSNGPRDRPVRQRLHGAVRRRQRAARHVRSGGRRRARRRRRQLDGGGAVGRRVVRVGVRRGHHRRDGEEEPRGEEAAQYRSLPCEAYPERQACVTRE